jgi:hypothetical protein
VPIFSSDGHGAGARRSRETCRAYISYFLRHWAHRKDAFDEVLDAFVDNFHKPGNLTGGFAHYRASRAGRIAMMKGELPAMPRIAPPTHGGTLVTEQSQTPQAPLLAHPRTGDVGSRGLSIGARPAPRRRRSGS